MTAPANGPVPGASPWRLDEAEMMPGPEVYEVSQTTCPLWVSTPLSVNYRGRQDYPGGACDGPTQAGEPQIQGLQSDRCVPDSGSLWMTVQVLHCTTPGICP